MPDQEVLPVEILEQIIKELWRDRKALQSCARVCKILCELSQRHLFSTVRIKTQGEIQILWQIFQQSPHLPSFVRHLVLNFTYRQKNRTTTFAYMESDLPAVLGSFTRVQSIEISAHIAWNTLREELQAAFRTLLALPSVIRLTVNKDVTFPASVLFGPELTYFHWHLEREGTKNQFCGDDLDFTVEPSPPKRFLTTLVLQYRIPEWAFQWLMDPQCPISVDRLNALHIHVDLSESNSTTFLPVKILQATAPSLTLLHLDVNIEAWTQQIIDLSQLSRLRKLYIRFDAWLQQMTPHNPIGWLNRTLRTLPPETHIEKIGFGCDFVREYDFRDEEFTEEQVRMLRHDLPWEELDQILTRPGHRKLRSIQWKVDEELESIFLDSLPECRRSGLLQLIVTAAASSSDPTDSEEVRSSGPMSLGDSHFGF